MNFEGAPETAEERAARYAWEARHYLWLGNQIVRLGQMGSLVHDMQVKREELRRTVPWQYIEDAMKKGVGVNEKGNFHYEPRVFYNTDESVSDQYWRSTPQYAAWFAQEWEKKRKKKDKAAALLQRAAAAFLRQEERKRKRESE